MEQAPAVLGEGADGAGAAGMARAASAVSVVVCCYTESRWGDLVAAVGSVRRQTLPPYEVIVVVDHNEALLARCVAAFPDARVLASTGSRGLSGARNTGIAAATGDIVAFLDDDARADDDWLAAMAAVYSDTRVLGAGGHIRPLWPQHRPPWWPAAFDWVVGCSYDGASPEVREVRNPIGANMSFRRSVFELVGGFREELGRADGQAAGCEETELSIRVRQAAPDARILLTPAARVAHRVSAERTTLRYFVRRCYAEGRSKAAVSSQVGSHDALSSERGYLVRTLPSCIANVAATASTRAAVRAAGAAALGVAAAGTGYLAASIRIRRVAS